MQKNNTTTIDEPTYRSVSNFLIKEAELLDNGKFREWFELMAPDIRYKMPVRVTREKAGGSGLIDKMGNFDEDWTSMEMRVLRLETEYAWSEDPPSRTRHVVSNVRVEPSDNDDEVKVKSYLLLYRFRGDSPTHDLLSAEREDVLRRKDESWLLANRLIRLDQTSLNTMNLAVFL